MDVNTPPSNGRLLSLPEMAADLGVSPQTFRKDFKDKNIPHLIVGKRPRFDPVRVRAYLVAQPETPSNVVQLKLAKPVKMKPAPSRFAAKVNVDQHG